MSLLVLLLTSALALDTGLIAGLNQEGIDNLKDNLWPIVVNNSQPLHVKSYYKVIPDSYNGLRFYLTNIYIANFTANYTASVIQLVSPDTLNISLQNITANMLFNWEYDDILGGDRGASNFTFYDAEFNLTVVLSDTKNCLGLNVTEANVSIANMDFLVKETAVAPQTTWFLHAYKTSVIKGIENQLESYFLNEFSADFSSQVKCSQPLPVLEKIVFNYSLTQAPQVNDTYLQVFDYGMFFYVGAQKEIPPLQPPVKLPGYSLAGMEFQGALSETSVNSFLYAAYFANYIQGNLTNATFYELTGNNLTTATLDPIFPGLYAKYNETLPCYFNCRATYPVPQVQLSAGVPHGSVSGNATFDCKLMVQNGTTDDLAIEFTANLTGAGTFWMQSWTIYGRISYVIIQNLAVVVNNISDSLDISKAIPALNLGLKAIIGAVNSVLTAQGVPLPEVQYTNLTESVGELSQRCLTVAATPQFD